MKWIFGIALSALMLGGGAIDGHAASGYELSTTACSAKGKDVTIDGKAATVYCGACEGDGSSRLADDDVPERDLRLDEQLLQAPAPLGHTA